MIHEGERLEREIKQLERRLETPISDEERRRVEVAIAQLRWKKDAWHRPH